MGELEDVHRDTVPNLVDSKEEIEILVWQQRENRHGVHHAGRSGEHRHLRIAPSVTETLLEKYSVQDHGDQNEEDVADKSVEEDDNELVEEVFVIHLVSRVH